MLDEALGDLGAKVELVASHDDPSTASPVETPLWDSLARVTQALTQLLRQLAQFAIGQCGHQEISWGKAPLYPKSAQLSRPSQARTKEQPATYVTGCRASRSDLSSARAASYRTSWAPPGTRCRC